jgi:hyaluronoglucosaminidase
MIPSLGIIEGYYGRMWTWEDRARVAETLGPAGYSFYHYAPKFDRRLREEWRLPHDPADVTAIKGFASVARKHGLRFGVGLSPYGLHLDFNAEAKAALKAKIKQLNAMKLDDLAILFDDMRGDVEGLAETQGDIVAFILDHSKASKFFVCPGYYSDDAILDRAFGKRPANYLKEFGKRLDPAIAVYWTGEEVVSPAYSPRHLDRVAEELGRKVALWDNYPVNDGATMSQYLHLRGFNGRGPDIAGSITHHAVNPALQPTLSLIPALTLVEAYGKGGAYAYGEATLAAAIKVAGDVLGARIHADLFPLQQIGLDRLGKRRVSLRERYAAYDHPAAREIVAWLDDEYRFDPGVVATQ